MHISQGFVFPWHFRLFGILLLLGGLAASTVNLILSLVMGVVGFTLISLRAGIFFDLENKSYQPFHSILGLKFGKKLLLKEIEKIYLNQNQERRKMYSAHTATGHTSENTIYDGYLKFIDGEKVYLKSSKKKNAINLELKSLAQYLHVSFIDNTRQV